MSEFSCVMCSIPNKLHNSIAKIQKHIPKESIIEIEDYYHITLLYGLHSQDIDEIEQAVIKILSVMPKIKGKFKKITKFDEGKKGYPIKFDIESKSLEVANYLLKSNCKHTQTFEYHPHATLAYVDGSTKLKLPNILYDVEFEIEEIKISNAVKEHKLIKV